MRRRHFLSAVFVALPAFGETRKDSVRGKLIEGPAIRTAQGRIVPLAGDGPTMGVLKDPRVVGSDFEAVGSFSTPERFSIEPIHNRAMFVHKDGKKLMVTYWCDVCYIRTYTPGVCWCCQADTALDLIEK